MRLDHPDLAPNVWTNFAEVPGNGVDDDANGYVDDVHGVDLTTSARAGQDLHDGYGHGTHVAGIDRRAPPTAAAWSASRSGRS